MSKKYKDNEALRKIIDGVKVVFHSYYNAHTPHDKSKKVGYAK